MNHSLALHRDDYEVRPVPMATARAVIFAHHYARGGSNTATFRHGLFERGSAECLGVAWWIPPAPPAASSSWHGLLTEALALSRFALVPDAPANAASFLLARSIHLIKADRRYRCLITYADTWQAHTGGLYQLMGWELVGMTKPRAVWLDGEGRMVSPRAHDRTRRAAEMRSLGYRLIGRFPKYKYRLVLDPPPRLTPILWEKIMLPPRSEPTDLELAERGRTGDGVALDQFVRRHTPMIHRQIDQIRLPSRVSRDDLVQEGMIALYRAAVHWREEAGTKLTTYCWYAVNRAIRDEIGRQLRAPLPLDPRDSTEDCEQDSGGMPSLARIPAREHLDHPEIEAALERLTPIARTMVRLAYGLDGPVMPWRVLARRFGMSMRQAREFVAAALEEARDGME